MEEIKWCNTIKQLEKEFANTLNAEYRICENPTCYYILVEDYSGEPVAKHKTGLWSEIIDFCSTHCNSGYDLMNGLGCTDDQLVEATENYIHSLGKKTRCERYLEENGLL